MKSGQRIYSDFFRRLSLPVRGAWVEIARPAVAGIPLVSLPVRGAWVEIAKVVLQATTSETVAPRAGSVG